MSKKETREERACHILQAKENYINSLPIINRIKMKIIHLFFGDIYNEIMQNYDLIINNEYDIKQLNERIGELEKLIYNHVEK